ncbi:hypothetical protein HOC13_01250, partial [Candidatus Woesearchaeota archaeon]|nr:hypothetical protein [Candidatus Woesearchaeota archaeon]
MRKILILTLFIILCSTLAVAGELTEHTVNVEGKQRNFYVYLPDNYNPEYQYPLLFMFHGLGGNYNDVSSESYGIKELADQNQFIAVFPDSLSNIPPKDITWNNFVLFPGYDTFALPGSSQTKRWDISHVQSSDRYNSQDVKFVDAIKDYLGPSVLDTHVFSTGHSYGAIFSYYLAMSRPELITSFGSHSGGLLKFLEDQELIDSVKNNLPIQQKFWFNFYINYLNGLPEEQVEWTIFPIPVRKGVQVPGILISSTKDSVVPYKWSQVLQADLTKHNHPNQLITLNNAELYGHGWDKSKNQVQWDFFIEHAPAIVEFVTTENSGVESDSPKQISLRLNSAREQSVVIALQKSGTANAEDFTVPLTVTFLPGEVEKTINLEIISDDLIEED